MEPRQQQDRASDHVDDHERQGRSSWRRVTLGSAAVLTALAIGVAGLVAVGLLPRYIVGALASPQVLQAQDGVQVLATGPVTRSGLEGELTGVVEVVDGCLGVRADGDGVVVAWPRGSRPLEDGRGVRLAGGQRVLVGDPISAGGGLEEWGPEVPTGTCGDHDRAWVLADVELD